MMKFALLGAAWLFDDALPQFELDEDFPRLMQIVAQHDMKLQQFRTLHGMFSSLSTGELDVMRLILEGKHNNQIAAELSISIRTVESRRANTYRKCNVASLAELARNYYQYEALEQIFNPVASPQSAQVAGK